MGGGPDHPGLGCDSALIVIGKRIGSLPVLNLAEAADGVCPLVIGEEDIAPGVCIALTDRSV